MENSCIYSRSSSRQTRKDISRPRFAFSDSLVKEQHLLIAGAHIYRDSQTPQPALKFACICLEKAGDAARIAGPVVRRASIMLFTPSVNLDASSAVRPVWLAPACCLTKLRSGGTDPHDATSVPTHPIW
jgi:hypothetical protein